MPLPNFIIIGSPKAGTSSLAKWIAVHPDVFFFPAKETHFFNFKFEKGIDWYSNLFTKASDGQLIGEATPDYTEGDTNTIAKRMANVVPNAKLIFIVRHPIDRLESHYYQCISNGMRPIPFDEAVNSWPTLVKTSLYNEQIKPFFEHYEKSNILILFMEDLQKDEKGLLRRVFNFLGLDPDRFDFSQLDTSIENARSTKSVDGALLRVLRPLKFFDDIKWLFPRSLVLFFKKHLKRSVTIEDWPIDWRGVDASTILDELKYDSAAFLERAGQENITWEISQDYLDRR